MNDILDYDKIKNMIKYIMIYILWQPKQKSTAKIHEKVTIDEDYSFVVGHGATGFNQRKDKVHHGKISESNHIKSLNLLFIDIWRGKNHLSKR